MNNVVSQIIKENITSVKEIHNSVSNLNYLINNTHVVRIKRYKDPFYSYKHEAEVLHKTAHLFLSERVTYLDHDGNKVSDYIANTHSFRGHNEEIIKAAKMLSTLHDSKIKTRSKFHLWQRFYSYKKVCAEEPFKHEKALIKKAKNYCHKYHKVLTHNDVVANNFLYTKNRSYLIDYEFSGMNIALFDLASFISENNITDHDKIALFLDSYGFDMDNLDDLENMIMFTNIFWYYWASERYKTTGDKVYLKIKKEKRKKIDNDLKALLLYKAKVAPLGKVNK